MHCSCGNDNLSRNPAPRLDVARNLIPNYNNSCLKDCKRIFQKKKRTIIITARRYLRTRPLPEERRVWRVWKRGGQSGVRVEV